MARELYQARRLWIMRILSPFGVKIFPSSIMTHPDPDLLLSSLLLNLYSAFSLKSLGQLAWYQPPLYPHDNLVT